MEVGGFWVSKDGVCILNFMVPNKRVIDLRRYIHISI